jgi:hypothetical protein
VRARPQTQTCIAYARRRYENRNKTGYHGGTAGFNLGGCRGESHRTCDRESNTARDDRAATRRGIAKTRGNRMVSSLVPRLTSTFSQDAARRVGHCNFTDTGARDRTAVCTGLCKQTRPTG